MSTHPKLYGDYQEKISLPTYPFAKESHWIDKNNKPHIFLHPLIDENISNLRSIIFSKLFIGSEFYLLQHQVNHESVLPGAVCLEMVQTAANLILPTARVKALHNIVWKQSIKGMDLLQPVHVNLIPDVDFISFVITDKEESRSYVQGEILYTEELFSPVSASLNIQALQLTLVNTQSPGEIYSYFSSMGLTYGPNFRVIQTLHYNDQTVLAELALPSQILSKPNEFKLHPCLFDGILQTTQALLKNKETLYLPFFISKIDIYNDLPNSCSVYVNLISDPENEHFPVFNIQVIDKEENLLLVITEFTLCALVKKEVEHHVSTQYYYPVWIEQPLVAQASKVARSVLLLGTHKAMVKSIESQFKNNHIITRVIHDIYLEHLSSESLEDYIVVALEIPNHEDFSIEGIQEQLTQSYYLVHMLAVKVISLKPKRPIQIVCVTQSHSIFCRALVGFAKTLQQELPNSSCRFIELHDFSLLLDELNHHETQVRYDKNNRRYINHYQLIPETPILNPHPVFQRGGVYLISGGMGGLGYLFANHFAEQYKAKIVLIGRSNLNEQYSKLIAALEMKGASVVYEQADVSDYEEVLALIQSVKLRFGAINGVIHAAGITHDSFILNKTKDEIATVLAPKIQGTYNLHAATCNESLDFFVLFSSVAAVFGNAGQSDYAYANCFLDEFAKEREQLRLQGKCSGRTLSINWPLWEEGGLKIAPEYQRQLEQTLGIVSLSTQNGLFAFSQALQQNYSNFIVLPGYQEKLVAQLYHQSLVPKLLISHFVEANEHVREKTALYLKKLIADILKLAPENLDPSAPFEQYGIDSLMIIQLNQRLESTFKALPKTLFFEYQNLSALTDYFIEYHSNALSQFISEPDIKKAASILPMPILPKRLNLIEKSLKSESNDIAIIGVHGRYPKACDISEFWDNLQAGKDCIEEIPEDRWNLLDYFDENREALGKTYSKWGGFLTDVDQFDPLFFNISPGDAALMDPQERLFLETAWKTIEDAGFSQEQLAGKKVGVYVGVMYGQYQLFGNESQQKKHFVPTNSLFSSIANRVSYFFDFHGPSISLDTMCSSSLTAIHLACKSIIDGECQLALAGGVNLTLHPNKYLLLSHGRFLSTEGHCRSFGEGGDGYVPGEGVGAVLLKPLHKALADGDHVYAVIKGSHLNHGGKTNGYTVPNPNAQAELIEETYQQAKIDPSLVSYLEAHGTGTSLGDPIEIAGLNKVFSQQGRQSKCSIGSVKSNIGHCESAAGIAAVTKVLLQLQHRTLVPSILSEHLNTNIDWTTIPFKVQQTLSEWKVPQISINGHLQNGSRIAGISSFGAGGSNAHLILAEVPERLQPPSDQKSHYLLTVSAKTSLALKQRLLDLLAWIQKNPSARLEDMSYTLNIGRSHFGCRCALVVGSLEELHLLLQQIDAPHLSDNLFFHDALDNNATKEMFSSTMLFALMQQLAQTHQYRETLLALARGYVNGNNLDWDSLHSNEMRQKIPLPTYPFAKERYWYSDEEALITTPVNQMGSLINEPSIMDKVTVFLMKQVTQILKITQHKIEVEKNLGEYGMDSVHFVALAKKIADHYQVEFTPTVFYTHSSVLSLSQYIVRHFPESAPAPASVVAMKLPNNTETSNYLKTHESDSIAIIGMQGLFPQSDDLATFWHHLVEGHDLVTEVPKERWNWHDYYGDVKIHADKSNSKWGGFINNVAHFDAGFFNISAREANLMDPQQRLFLEIAWKTIEDAGYNPFELPSQKVGVFAGVEFSEYQNLIAKHQKDFHGFIATGNSHSLIANRVSYFFNFQGPSEAIDTACSSSLVAIHRAVLSIQNGECDTALAGGVSLMLNPDTLVITSQLGALSTDGRCKTFDKSANGYVKGEGVAAILLKPLRQAQLDGDRIYGVIKSSAVNHGGKAQSLTAPNACAQSELLISAYSKAAISPDTITYIETHGTGTALGDPVEIEGLKLAFDTLLATKAKITPIALGSVKTNIGHLEPASGIAGLIKIILAMSHEVIPGILHFNELNPYIQLTDTPFYIAEKKQAWRRSKNEAGQEIPLRAGVSSFGFGGTNAHIVIEEGRIHQQNDVGNHVKPYYLVTFSAKQQESLLQKLKDMHQWLELNREKVSLSSLCFTLNVGRASFNWRCALVVNSVDELSSALTLLINNETPEYCMINNGQVGTVQGPVFDEVYQSAMSGIQQVDNVNQYRYKLFVLADLYTKHYPIDWQQFYRGNTIQRIGSLPAYPFIKQRYWYDLELNPTIVLEQPLPVNKPVLTDFSGHVLTYLQRIFAEKLRIPPEHIQIDETYEVYGVDSILGLEITNRLEKDFGTLPKTLLYERNRLSDLAQYFIKNYKEKLLALVSEGDAVTLTLESSSPDPMRLTLPTTAALGNRDIAIIGLSGTFPMANTMDEFWNNLATGRDCVGEVPIERWNYKDYPVMIGGEERYFPHGGFIPDVDKFDPLFFNISPRDAGLMDPQERLFMQSVWSTLEDSGYTREKLKRTVQNSVGVFVGVTYNFYPLFIAEEWQKGNRVPLDIQSFSVANRISYFLNLNGPSFVVDTACSSSLAAIHLASESILRGECAMAIAGGVNLSLHPSKYHFLGSFSFMSEQGRCTSFAEGGTGYVPSEGVGSVLLKPLADAVRDNDLIYGVIKGTSMNHGGKTSGYTVPNPNAQTEVILKALKNADIDPRTLSYIEAHGTGTALGDPIEVRGLQEAFEHYTQDKQFCAIGSVKSNIGHLESAAGISQLAKVVLQMRHQQLVPTLHAEQLNPFIDFANSPFYVQRDLKPWKPDNNMPRRAGVSSFGAGGSNVHLIIEEYLPQSITEDRITRPYLFLMSALNEERLLAQVQQMHFYLQHYNHTDEALWLRNACYTLQVGREHRVARLGIMVTTKDELLTALANYPNVSHSNAWINFHSQNNEMSEADLCELIKDSRDEALVQHWVNGAKVDWDQLYQQQSPQLVSLPTYLFTKRRCWIPTIGAIEQVPEAPQPKVLLIENKELFHCKDWLYTTQWEKNSCDKQSESKNNDGKWLIFSDKELGLVLQQELKSTSCIYCFVGDNFERINDSVFYIDPSQSADYDKLFKQVNTENGKHLKGVIYLCSAIDTTEEHFVDPSLSLLYTFKGLIKHSWNQQLTFCLVSQSAQQVIPQDKVTIWQHHLWSMTRIFAAEQASYQVLMLDLDVNERLVQNASILMNELGHLQSNQNHIAYRANERYSIRFNPNPQPPIKEQAPWTAPIAALITGGLGALGYEVAEFLVAAGTQFVLLTGVTVLSSQTQEKNTWLNQLETKGVQVKYVAVDVADKEKMQQVIEETENIWNTPIDGVFHLAGVTTDNVPIADMDEALWRKVLKVKITGAMVLHELFLQSKLSCFVLFSSIAAVPHFGMAGLSAYAVANEFINGLALYRRSIQMPAQSINWVAWSEKGMSHRHNHDAFLDAVGMTSLGIKEGIELLSQVLQSNHPEITVCKIEWKKFLQVNATAKQLDFFTHFIAEHSVAPKIAMVSPMTKEQITTTVLKNFATVLALEIDEVDRDTPFQQYGMDSIIGIHFAAELGSNFPDVVSPMDLYRYPTLKQMTDYIIQRVHRDNEPIHIQTFNKEDEMVDIEHLNTEQLNELIELELKELELTYD
jgi:polyketide synthase PksL